MDTNSDQSKSIKPAINPNALTISQSCAMLKRFGFEVTEEMFRQDIESGAPTNPDGSIHLIHFSAWQKKQYVEY